MNKKLLHLILFLVFPFLVLGLLPLLIVLPLILPPLVVLFPGLLLIVAMVLTGFSGDKRDSKSL
jgi:ABC-type molybdate transport system permease subunit